MKIEIWSDYACPFCCIGLRSFASALQDFEHKDQVQVIHRCFELDRRAAKGTGEDVVEQLARKYGMPRSKVEQMNAQIAEQARLLGMEFHLDRLVATNTHDAHRLSLLAREEGREEACRERLFRAYFTDNVDIGDHAVLARLSQEVGLDPDRVREVLSGDQFHREVMDDEIRADLCQCGGVPYFLIDEGFALSGAQPPATFLNVLRRTWDQNAFQSQFQ